jgi:hypothetical protein
VRKFCHARQEWLGGRDRQGPGRNFSRSAFMSTMRFSRDSVLYSALSNLYALAGVKKVGPLWCGIKGSVEFIRGSSQSELLIVVHAQGFLPGIETIVVRWLLAWVQ